ncbi:MAG: hypothetical protein C0407_17495, partial [Desulfobacca sp.]|nr:hypothetical protein [Desulfobacca sp.]
MINAQYISPSSLEEALGHLSRQGEKTRLLAGGTDVMVALRSARMEGNKGPEFLLDISGISELKAIVFQDNEVVIGAGITFQELESHPQLLQKVPLLMKAASRIGSVQIRCLATLGGNVGTSSPAGDGISPLVALGAMARIASSEGQRSVPVDELITGPGENALTCNELILSFSIPCPLQPQACFFDKVMRRQAVAIARMNLAVQLALEPSGKIQSAAVAAGAILPRPGRLAEVEQEIIGQIPGEDLFLNAAETATRIMREA